MNRAQTLLRLARFLSGEGFFCTDFTHTNSCFDLVARRENTRLLVKVLENVDALRAQNARDLESVAGYLGYAAIVVGQKTKAFSLQDGVAYERYGIPVLSPRTFEDSVRGELPHARYFKGRHSVALDAQAVRARRSEAGFSASELALRVGTTPETIYRYEQGFAASENAAKKLSRALGQSVVQAIDVLAPAEPAQDHRTPRGERALFALRALGVRVQPFSHAPFSAIGHDRSPVVVSTAKNQLQADWKSPHVARAGEAFQSSPFIVAHESKREKSGDTPIVREEELARLKSAKDLFRLLRERREED